MSSTADKASTAHPLSLRRPHDAAASRQALLSAASSLFDERGYEATTVREIGERAHLDPSLIARYFGGKEGLYLATLSQQDRPPLPNDAAQALATILARSDHNGLGPIPLAMVDPNLSEPLREQIRHIIQTRAIEPIAAGLARHGVPEPQLRAELLLALALGLSLTRGSGTLTLLADAPLPELLESLAPLIEVLQEPAAAVPEIPSA